MGYAMHSADEHIERVFPRYALVVPAPVPLSIVAVTYFVESTGHRWNIHGDFGAVIILVSLTSAVAFVMELFALRRAIFHLRQRRADRVPINWVCTSFAATYVVAFALAACWLIASALK